MKSAPRARNLDLPVRFIRTSAVTQAAFAVRDVFCAGAEKAAAFFHFDGLKVAFDPRKRGPPLLGGGPPVADQDGHPDQRISDIFLLGNRTMNTSTIRTTPPNNNFSFTKTWKRLARFVIWISSILVSMHHVEIAYAEAISAPVDRSAIKEGLTVLMENSDTMSAGTAFLAGLSVLHASATAFFGYFLTHWGATAIALFCLFETGRHLGKGIKQLKRWRQGLRS